MQKKRTYKYLIINRKNYLVLDKNRAWHVKKKLNINSMKKAIKLFLGTHDFNAFRSSSCGAKSPVRTIKKAVITKKGNKIIEYKGKIITVKETETNPKFDNDKAIYLFNLNKKYDLDGDFNYNTARLINHSCDPNCEVDGVGLKLWIYSIKDIKKNEELTYDYGFSFDKDYKNYPCRCGTKKCVGFIVKSESRWRIKKSKKNKSISK